MTKIKTRIITVIIAVLSLFFGISTTSYAAVDSPPKYVKIGVIGSYGIDTPITNPAANQKPVLVGGEVEVGFQDSPFSYRVQMGTAQVGTNLSASLYTATYTNLFIQYNFDKRWGLYPYFGYGYSGITFSPAISYSGWTGGWIAGVNYPISPNFVVGAFYNGFDFVNRGVVYNHFVGIDLSYKFNL